MLRGAQKQMIVVRTRDSRMFEEAYFVMRRGAGHTEADEMDMLWEANRIIENSLPSGARSAPIRTGAETVKPPAAGLARWMWFLFGLLFGSGSVGLLWLLL